MDRHDLGLTIPWMAEGTSVLLAQMDHLTDDAVAAPSRLIGWTNAHLIAHAALNAEALMRLLTWARTGVETPMYGSPEQRNTDIETGSRQAPAGLRTDVRRTSDALAAAVDACDAAVWQQPVRSAQGREIPAAEIPWMRVREVWLHAVDLGGGTATVADLPADLAALLVADVCTVLTNRGEGPSLRLSDPATGEAWTMGEAGTGQTVAGPVQTLAGWLTGRTPNVGLSGDTDLPPIPRWI